jgi:hypothetical protein
LQSSAEVLFSSPDERYIVFDEYGPMHHQHSSYDVPSRTPPCSSLHEAPFTSPHALLTIHLYIRSSSTHRQCSAVRPEIRFIHTSPCSVKFHFEGAETSNRGCKRWRRRCSIPLSGRDCHSVFPFSRCWSAVLCCAGVVATPHSPLDRE